MSNALLKSRCKTSTATLLLTLAVIAVSLADEVCFAPGRASWLFPVTFRCLKMSSGSVCSLHFLGAEVKLTGL